MRKLGYFVLFVLFLVGVYFIPKGYSLLTTTLTDIFSLGNDGSGGPLIRIASDGGIITAGANTFSGTTELSGSNTISGATTVTNTITTKGTTIIVSTATTSTSSLRLGGSVATLPVTGYSAGTLVVLTPNFLVYVATETVAGTFSWVKVGAQ